MFGPHELYQQGIPSFKWLTQITHEAATIPAKQILCDLLANSTAAFYFLIFFIILQRFFHRLKIKAIVLGKFLIFGSD